MTTTVGHPTLFGDPLVYPELQGLTLQQRFEAFHRANPWVYNRLVIMARNWKVGRREVGSISMFVETIRWEYGQTTSDDDFKINNDYRSRYSRLIMEQEPDLDGFFHTRELKA